MSGDAAERLRIGSATTLDEPVSETIVSLFYFFFLLFISIFVMNICIKSTS